MKFVRFQIENYKVIDEIAPIPIDARVTALVGKNESGKTAVLKALWKSRNVAKSAFDKLYDYPRARYAQDRKGTQTITTLEFELTLKEAKALVTYLPHLPAIQPICIVYRRSYAGEDLIHQQIVFDSLDTGTMEKEKISSAIDAVIEPLESSSSVEWDPVSQATRTALDALEQINENALLWTPETIQALDSFNVAVTTWICADSSRKDMAVAERQQFDVLMTQLQACAWIEANLPIFIYFDDYGQLDTRIHLPSYLTSTKSSDSKVRTQTALFEWSQIDPQEILDLGRPRRSGESEEQIQRRYEKRRALLDSASFVLTGDWIAWWTDKRHRLHFDADGEDLVLKVSDQHNEFPIPFEERSRGFQWFFSFYLVFLAESKKAHKGAILLLDEPGLHLHPTLQVKLLALFEKIAANNQLIYSTHLPFLVDGNHLERVRTVYLDGSDPQKTCVSADVQPGGDRETLFPLQAALGYSIAQTLFLGKRSLIVEGITDYWLIKALNACIPQLDGQPGLHEDTVLIPMGGTKHLMPLAAIMVASTDISRGRSLVVLLDSDDAGRQAAQRINNKFSEDLPVLMLGSTINRTEATIEDLVPRDAYVTAVKQAGYDIELRQDEKNALTNVKAMEKAFQRLEFGKFGPVKDSVARILMDAWSQDPSKISDCTCTQARALINAINAQFEI